MRPFESIASSRAETFFPAAREHARDEERRIPVGDDDAGACGERGQQAAGGAGTGLDVRVVERGGAARDPAVVCHPVEDEAVQPVARVRIVAAAALRR